MRNQILWTCKLEEALRQKGFSLLDVSKIISERFETEKDAILSDPARVIKKILDSAILPGAKGIVFCNIGMLLEPELHISAEKLLLDYAVSYTVVLFWPYTIHNKRSLVWDPAQLSYCIEFSEHILQPLEPKR